MQCPKCKFKHREINKHGKIVSRNLNVCTICGFVLNSSESERFVERCAEMIQRHITDFKRTRDVDSVFKANTYLQTLIEEVSDNAH